MRRRGVPGDGEGGDSGFAGFKIRYHPVLDVDCVAQEIGLLGVKSWGERKHLSNGISFKSVPFCSTLFHFCCYCKVGAAALVGRESRERGVDSEKSLNFVTSSTIS